MEKVIYALWRDPRDTRAEFSRKLREEAAPKLLALGARGLQVNVCDDVVLGANTWRVATRPQMEGVVHLWVDSAINMFRKPYDEVLESVAGRIAGYLVSESNGVVMKPENRSRPGERTHGFSQCVFIVRPKRTSPEEMDRGVAQQDDPGGDRVPGQFLLCRQCGRQAADPRRAHL